MLRYGDLGRCTVAPCGTATEMVIVTLQVICIIITIIFRSACKIVKYYSTVIDE